MKDHSLSIVPLKLMSASRGGGVLLEAGARALFGTQNFFKV